MNSSHSLEDETKEDQELKFPEVEGEYMECIFKCTPYKVVSHEKFKDCFRRCFEKRLEEVLG